MMIFNQFTTAEQAYKPTFHGKDLNFLQLNRNSLQSELLSQQSNLKSLLHLSKDGVFPNNYKGNQFNKETKLNRVNQSN